LFAVQGLEWGVWGWVQECVQRAQRMTFCCRGNIENETSLRLTGQSPRHGCDFGQEKETRTGTGTGTGTEIEERGIGGRERDGEMPSEGDRNAWHLTYAKSI